MIELRVDDRLIHGQVAMLWSKHLKIKGIMSQIIKQLKTKCNKLL